MRRPFRGALFLTALFLASAPEARADWLLTPFIGTTFAGKSAFVTFEPEAVRAKHWLIGGSAGWLSDNVFGIEADVALVPGFFGDENPIVTSNRVTTISGSVIAAVPLSITRESLRPYILGGFGLVHTVLEDQICLLGCVSESNGALQLGGGAIGLVTDRAGVRFDLRQIRTLAREDTLTGDRRAKLSFWRASVGVVVRY